MRVPKRSMLRAYFEVLPGKSKQAKLCVVELVVARSGASGLQNSLVLPWQLHDAVVEPNGFGSEHGQGMDSSCARRALICTHTPTVVLSVPSQQRPIEVDQLEQSGEMTGAYR